MWQAEALGGWVVGEADDVRVVLLGRKFPRPPETIARLVPKASVDGEGERRTTTQPHFAGDQGVPVIEVPLTSQPGKFSASGARESHTVGAIALNVLADTPSQ